MLTSYCFTVYLEECELAKQLHPRENDLVFLVPERLNEEKKDLEWSHLEDACEYYCGYVHKFRRTSVSEYLVRLCREVCQKLVFSFPSLLGFTSHVFAVHLAGVHLSDLCL